MGAEEDELTELVQRRAKALVQMGLGSRYHYFDGVAVTILEIAENAERARMVAVKYPKVEDRILRDKRRQDAQKKRYLKKALKTMRKRAKREQEEFIVPPRGRAFEIVMGVLLGAACIAFGIVFAFLMTIICERLD